MPRGDGGGGCPPRAPTRRLARHLCRQHRSESDIFSPENQRINLLRKSNANPEKSGRLRLWTVTRKWPNPSKIWLVEMYIWTYRLPRRLSDAQRRGRTTHWVYRGDGGGRCPPRARTRRLARHLCRQHRSESDIFSPENPSINLLRKSNGNL